MRRTTYGARNFKSACSSCRESRARVLMCMITVPVIRGGRLIGAAWHREQFAANARSPASACVVRTSLLLRAGPARLPAAPGQASSPRGTRIGTLTLWQASFLFSKPQGNREPVGNPRVPYVCVLLTVETSSITRDQAQIVFQVVIQTCSRTSCSESVAARSHLRAAERPAEYVRQIALSG